MNIFKKQCLLVGVLLCAQISLNACAEDNKNKSVEHDHAAMSHMDHSKHEAMPAGKPTDMSVYNLDSQWTDHNHQKHKLQDFGGQAQLVALVYASCQNACPRIIVDMKNIESKVQERFSSSVKLILVSIDPEVDTPEKLKALAEKSHLGQNWHLLQGEPEDVLELAAMLGVKYKKISERDYAHSNIISVLNPQGEVTHQQVGLGVEPTETLEALEKLFASS